MSNIKKDVRIKIHSELYDVDASLFSDENYLSLIGIRNYQLYKNFLDYPVDIYRRIYSVLMESIRRIKLGENSETVMAECLTQSLTVLKEKNYV